MLAIDDPLADPDSTFSLVLKTIDFFFTILFTIEMILKVISMGFYWKPDYYPRGDIPPPYLKVGWNILDFVVVVTAWLNMALGDSAGGLKALRSIRALRALRPLRMISRNEGLKLAINSLFRSIPELG